MVKHFVFDICSIRRILIHSNYIVTTLEEIFHYVSTGSSRRSGYENSFQDMGPFQAGLLA
jgi:hypothetical protein